ncbi:hypothetical protein [Rathayibacter sp. VKM Ac-2630]|uniref:hypothetical protein n=1 Tax=Rathayibacter sp. VKM Ac-2630 TaxID=1938617 RepID=UPI0009821754|nr:hypothetical protein [Rathayibacter sp. VKM Ac-2630]OOB91941.1 hypothetical protein B0T42_03365 [Rathayibacter sp. VKM Ac-2630]
MNGSEAADWISALATIGALGAAVWAVVVSRRLHRVETDRDEVSAERAKREQASGIAARCIGRSAEDERQRRGLLLHNSSDAPVFEVEVSSTYAPRKSHEPQRLAPLRLAILPPGDYVVFGDTTYPWTLPVERTARSEEAVPIMNNPGWTVTEMSFRDAHGLLWRRTGGSLHEVTTTP